MDTDLKPLYLTRQEAEYVLDSFKVSNPVTRNLTLKAAGLVLEFAADAAISQAGDLTEPKRIEITSG